MSLYIILFILGLCFGSFSTVLISRWKSGKGGIMLGRSECPHCNHTLSAMELIPLFSWLWQLGKCKKCKTPIPIYYPVSELFMGSIFVLIGWIVIRLGYPIISSITLIILFWGFITVVYSIYDLRYMEIPDQILIPGIVITLIFLFVGYIDESYILFFDYYSYQSFHTFISDHIIAAIFIYSFFFLQILIPGSIHLIQSKRYHDFFGLILSYFTFLVYILIQYFRGKEEENNDAEEIPTWIGGGDLRIGIFIGLTLGTMHSISTLIFAYIVGSIVGIIIIIHSKIQKKECSHMIPFGPFLGIGWFMSLIFYNEIIAYI